MVEHAEPEERPSPAVRVLCTVVLMIAFGGATLALLEVARPIPVYPQPLVTVCGECQKPGAYRACREGRVCDKCTTDCCKDGADKCCCIHADACACEPPKDPTTKPEGRP